MPKEGSIKRMSKKDEYYHYLRKDTSICELPTFIVNPPFEYVLDTIISSWRNCPICKDNSDPFIFEVNEVLFGDSLNYTIQTLTNIKLLQEINYSGAFDYNEYTFVVLEKSSDMSSFSYDEKNRVTKITLCDRIQESECGLKIKCTCINGICNVNIVCSEKEIIIIR